MPTMVNKGSQRRQIGWCINTILDPAKRKRKENWLCPRFSIRLSLVNVVLHFSKLNLFIIFIVITRTIIIIMAYFISSITLHSYHLIKLPNNNTDLLIFQFIIMMILLLLLEWSKANLGMKEDDIAEEALIMIIIHIHIISQWRNKLGVNFNLLILQVYIARVEIVSCFLVESMSGFQSLWPCLL